jgi:SAM-dependent methyltransferase
MSLTSLKLGQRFKQENGIENAAFVHMNLFRPVFAPESFDLVICNGVLHHTGDPFLGFQSISRLVKAGGYVVLGLYNKYGRIPTDLRRLVFKLFGNRLKFLDSRMNTEGLSDQRKHAWFMDQYKNPHESKHTIGEVLHWFERTGFEFVNSIPKATAFDSFSASEKLFETHPAGTRFDHFVAQAGLLLGGGKEGGFFVMIGRKDI